MVSSLLSHEGLSKKELYSIVGGIVDEIGKEVTNLPEIERTHFGMELDCSRIDENSILILAKIITHLSYLRRSNAGRELLRFLRKDSTDSFAEVIKEILVSDAAAVPIVRLSKLQVYFR